MFKKYSYLMALSALAILSAGQDLRAMAGAGAGSGKKVAAADISDAINKFNATALNLYGNLEEGRKLSDREVLVNVRLMSNGIFAIVPLDISSRQLRKKIQKELGFFGKFSLSGATTSRVFNARQRLCSKIQESNGIYDYFVFNSEDQKARDEIFKIVNSRIPGKKKFIDFTKA